MCKVWLGVMAMAASVFAADVILLKDNASVSGRILSEKADQVAIRAKEQVYRKSGDGLTKPEIKDLEKDLNKTSREIKRATHNRKTPGGN